MRISIRDLRLLIEQSLDPGDDDADEETFFDESKWNFFHLSRQDLGDSFTFTPRRPSMPMFGHGGYVIEDDFTRRISWAPSVHDAFEAMSPAVNGDIIHVYACNNLPGEIDVELTSGNFPTSNDNKYGMNFDLPKWEKWATNNDEVPEQFVEPDSNSQYGVPKALEDSVPDADETHEVWSTKPTNADRIGLIVVVNKDLGMYRPVPNDYVPLVLGKHRG